MAENVFTLASHWNNHLLDIEPWNKSNYPLNLKLLLCLQASSATIEKFDAILIPDAL